MPDEATPQHSEPLVPPGSAAGSLAGRIPVEITYRIIELFSAGLYSSPNKAIEELVSNSSDALATRVDVMLPASASVPGASIWVVDDGESMDLAGLKDLWQIARSPKSDRTARGGRLPIEKFGIGRAAYPSSDLVASSATRLNNSVARSGRTAAAKVAMVSPSLAR